MRDQTMKDYASRYTLTVAIAAWTLVAPAQATTLEQVEDAAKTAVEDQVLEQVTSAAAAQVEEAAAAQVEDAAVTRIESSVTSQVVDAAADQAVESVASGVTERVTERVSEQAAESVVSQAGAAAEERVQHVIDATAVGRIADQAGESVQGHVQGAVDAASRAGVQLPRQAADAAAAAVEQAGAVAGPAGKRLADAGTTPAPFVEGLDPQGRPIERNVLVLLVPQADMAAVRELGMKVGRERPLPGLDRVLVRLVVEPGLTLGQAAALVRQASAAAAVDYNHLYELNAAPAAGRSSSANDSAAPAARHLGSAIGVIDTAIAADHPALAGVRIVQRDFIGIQRSRPLGHGTAIASILVQESGRLSGLAPELYAANVFFERAPGIDSATTESIVAALGWLVEQDVTVVNMSLTGPPNELLQLAVEQAVGAGAHVVAAVGNNGPVGEPLYPAAYDSVIGVTAVDASEQVFVYANRGRQVMFAAPGVGVRVADSDGGYTEQDGTSLASAYAAVIIATSMTRLAQAGQGPHEVVDRLQRDARDLGPSGTDEIYGYGLIAPLDI